MHTCKQDSVVEDTASSGVRFLQHTELASNLLVHLPPADLKAFASSSLYASRFFNALSDACLDRYCEQYVDRFPRVESDHGHFIALGCTCTLALSSTHDLRPQAFTGDSFSDQFWRSDCETRAIERAVRLGRWCDERRGCTAQKFFAHCFQEEWRTSGHWWSRLMSWSHGKAAGTNLTP